MTPMRRIFSPSLFWANSRKLFFFDVLFGIIIPPFCLWLDPVVFRSDGSSPFLPELRLFAYISIPLYCVVLALWLFIKVFHRLVGGLFVGVFASGAVFALILGLLLLPFSLLGLFFMVGILGFLPFFTALVYLRTTVRAIDLLRRHLSSRQLLLVALIGFVIFAAPGVIAQWRVLQLYPDYNDIPLYIGAEQTETEDWHSINSGEGLEKRMIFETSDAPEVVVTYYRGLLSSLYWRQQEECNAGSVCFGYASATDQNYGIYIDSVKLRGDRYQIIITMQK